MRENRRRDKDYGGNAKDKDERRTCGSIQHETLPQGYPGSAQRNGDAGQRGLSHRRPKGYRRGEEDSHRRCYQRGYYLQVSHRINESCHHDRQRDDDQRERCHGVSFWRAQAVAPCATIR